MKSKFAVGDLVRHRASGEIAVVLKVCEECVKESHKGPLGCYSHKFQGCEVEPNGMIWVIYRITKIAKVHDTSYEKVTSNAQTGATDDAYGGDHETPDPDLQV